MAVRRTHKQRSEAHARRKRAVAHQEAQVSLPVKPTRSQGELQKILRTDISLLRKDILRSVLISLVLFAAIFGIVIYLS